MARQTRQQRHARREQRGEGGFTQRARARQAQVRPGSTPQKLQGGRRVRERKRFGMARESWAELKKVEWPGRTQVIQGTIVVLLACAIVGGYLAAADIVIKRLVQNILIG